MRLKTACTRRKRSCGGVWVSEPRQRIGIAGAGAIGFYIGGRLAQAGWDVAFLARPRLCDAVAAQGLTMTDYDGSEAVLQNLRVSSDPAVLSDADLIFVTVKSAATAEMARNLAEHAPRKATVVSLQNGVTNPQILANGLPEHDVRGGMVPFNVTQPAPTHFHCGTSGEILLERGSRAIPDLAAPGLVWQEVDDFEAVQWGKLLINLNNALNALADIPLLEQLQDRRWRLLMAAQIDEGLAVLRRAGISPARLTAAPPALIPFILRLPTWMFRRVAAQMMTIDPLARSSMWEDLTQRRPTEIDALQGAVLALALEHGLDCPVIERVTTALRAAADAQLGPPGVSPDTLLHH